MQRGEMVVAVKVLHSYLGADTGSLDRFLREARAASRLRNPHIITIWDTGVTDDGQPFFVMDYLEGKTLADLIKEKAILHPSRVLPIIRQICEALTEAHKQGIIHRDMKPENVVLEETDSGEDYVKLLDFGIADAPQEKIKLEKVAQTVAGSPAYMSPEQCQGFELDARSDIYSLGIVAFEMLTGDRPFKSDDHMSVMFMHVSKPPKKLSDIRPEIKFPQALEDVMAKALAKHPARRQASVREFWLEIEASLEGSEYASAAVTPTNSETQADLFSVPSADRLTGDSAVIVNEDVGGLKQTGWGFQQVPSSSVLRSKPELLPPTVAKPFNPPAASSPVTPPANNMQPSSLPTSSGPASQPPTATPTPPQPVAGGANLPKENSLTDQLSSIVYDATVKAVEKSSADIPAYGKLSSFVGGRKLENALPPGSMQPINRSGGNFNGAPNGPNGLSQLLKAASDSVAPAASPTSQAEDPAPPVASPTAQAPGPIAQAPNPAAPVANPTAQAESPAAPTTNSSYAAASLATLAQNPTSAMATPAGPANLPTPVTPPAPFAASAAPSAPVAPPLTPAAPTAPPNPTIPFGGPPAPTAPFNPATAPPAQANPVTTPPVGPGTAAPPVMQQTQEQVSAQLGDQTIRRSKEGATLVDRDGLKAFRPTEKPAPPTNGGMPSHSSPLNGANSGGAVENLPPPQDNFAGLPPGVSPMGRGGPTSQPIAPGSLVKPGNAMPPRRVPTKQGVQPLAPKVSNPRIDAMKPPSQSQDTAKPVNRSPFRQFTPGPNEIPVPTQAQTSSPAQAPADSLPGGLPRHPTGFVPIYREKDEPSIPNQAVQDKGLAKKTKVMPAFERPQPPVKAEQPKANPPVQSRPPESGQPLIARMANEISPAKKGVSPDPKDDPDSTLTLNAVRVEESFAPPEPVKDPDSTLVLEKVDVQKANALHDDESTLVLPAVKVDPSMSLEAVEGLPKISSSLDHAGDTISIELHKDSDIPGELHPRKTLSDLVSQPSALHHELSAEERNSEIKERASLEAAAKAAEVRASVESLAKETEELTSIETQRKIGSVEQIVSQKKEVRDSIEAQAKATEGFLEAEMKAAESISKMQFKGIKATEDDRIAAEAKAAEEARLAAQAKAEEEARLAAEAKAAEEARLAEAKAAEETRIAAEAKAAEEARLAAEAKAAEEARIAAEAKAAEEARLAAEAKAAEEARIAAEAKAAEEARIAAEAKAAEEARLAAEAKAAEEARLAKAEEEARIFAELRAAEEERIAQIKAAEEARIAAQAKAEEEARIAAAKAEEEARIAAEAKAAELARIAAEAQAAQEAILAAETKAAEEARMAAEAKAAEEARMAAEAKAEEEARIAAQAKAAELARIAAEAQAAQEAIVAAEAKANEVARIAKETKEAEEAQSFEEEAKRVAEIKQAEESRRTALAKAAEEARRATLAKAAEDARQAAIQKAAEEEAAKAAAAAAAAAAAIAELSQQGQSSAPASTTNSPDKPSTEEKAEEVYMTPEQKADEQARWMAEIEAADEARRSAELKASDDSLLLARARATQSNMLASDVRRAIDEAPNETSFSQDARRAEESRKAVQAAEEARARARAAARHEEEARAVAEASLHGLPTEAAVTDAKASHAKVKTAASRLFAAVKKNPSKTSLDSADDMSTSDSSLSDIGTSGSSLNNIPPPWKAQNQQQFEQQSPRQSLPLEPTSPDGYAAVNQMSNSTADFASRTFEMPYASPAASKGYQQQNKPASSTPITTGDMPSQPPAYSGSSYPNQNYNSANQMSASQPSYAEHSDIPDQSISELIEAKRYAESRRLAQTVEGDGEENIGTFVKQKYAALLAGISGPPKKGPRVSTRQKLPITNVSTRSRIAALRGRPQVNINGILFTILIVVLLAAFLYFFNLASDKGKVSEPSRVETLIEDGDYAQARHILEQKQEKGELPKKELEALARIYLSLAKEQKDDGNSAAALNLLKKVPPKSGSYKEATKLMKQLTKTPRSGRK
jgi:serine/threonine protein kinase